MRCLVAGFLLLLQLGPLAAAGWCLHATGETAVSECGGSMPAMPEMPGMPVGGSPSDHAPAPDCATMTVCAATAPAVPQELVVACLPEPPGAFAFNTPPAILPGDPVAPPQPPPIS